MENEIINIQDKQTIHYIEKSVSIIFEDILYERLTKSTEYTIQGKIEKVLMELKNLRCLYDYYVKLEKNYSYDFKYTIFLAFNHNLKWYAMDIVIPTDYLYSKPIQKDSFYEEYVMDDKSIEKTIIKEEIDYLQIARDVCGGY